MALVISVFPNDQNDIVRQLQLALNNVARANLLVDSQAGPKTIAAVTAFQKASKLTADGIAGPSTFKALRLTLTHPDITLADFKAAAETLRAPVAVLQAIDAVESSGNGFLPDGRPKILFERHIFYKQMIIPHKAGDTQQSLMAKRDLFASANPDICSPQTGGYVGGAGEYDRFARAQAFSDTAAKESCSWGSFQIMGFNAVAAGYPDVQTFVRAMCGSEGDHLRGLVAFIKSNPSLQAAAIRKDFLTFSKIYNGPSESGYDTKLAAAYAKFSAQTA